MRVFHARTDKLGSLSVCIFDPQNFLKSFGAEETTVRPRFYLSAGLLIPLLSAWVTAQPLGEALAPPPEELHAAFTEADPDERREFGVLYTVWIKPDRKTGVVKIRLKDNPEWVRWMELSIDPDRHTDFLSTGELAVEDGRVKWRPPAKDAWLQYDVDLISERDDGEYDGYITPEWAVLRADDLVPPIHSSLADRVMSRAKIDFKLPDAWSIVTRYPRYKSGRFKVDDPDRLFDRPTGWLAMGEIGTRRETIGGTRVAVSGPVDQGLRRMDLLALLNWTVPVMQDIFPEFPERLLIIGADDPMWRGALSGPDSLYLHNDRPMISGNATSTLVHELIHVAMGARSGPGADWIVEGLAEYYSLEVLRRSGTITEARFEKAHRELAQWGEQADELDGEHSSGAETAKAVAAPCHRYCVRSLYAAESPRGIASALR